MNNDTDDIIAISEAELRDMTRDLDEIDRDQARPAMAEAVAWMTESVHEEAAAEEGLRSRLLGRRTFLLGAGAVAGGIALAACGSRTSSTSTTTTTAPAGAPVETASQLATDLKVTALATSLEILAVTAYTDAINAVGAGKYGPVSAIPKAVPVFASTARSQHAAHRSAWNAVLVAAGKPKVTQPTTALVGPVTTQFKAITNLGGVLKLALALENVAAQTYQVGSTVVTSPQGIALAASIQPVEMQHAAILYFVLGMYPGIQSSGGTVLAFNPVANAAKLSDYTGPL